MTDTQIKWTKRIVIVAVLTMVVWCFSGCSGAGSHNNTSLTFYRPDGTVSCEVIDKDSVDFLNVLVTSKRKGVYVPTKYGYVMVGDSNTVPEDITVKANPILNQYELSTGDVK